MKLIDSLRYGFRPMRHLLMLQSPVLQGRRLPGPNLQGPTAQVRGDELMNNRTSRPFDNRFGVHTGQRVRAICARYSYL